MKEKLVSIIIAVYNAEMYLSDCLKSLLAQTYKDIEIILVDDGSTDNSYNICLKYVNAYNNVTVYQKQNEGSASARNLGLTHSQGEYAIFVDADDIVAQDYIEKMCDAIKDTDVVICAFDRFDENGIQSQKVLDFAGDISKETAFEHTFASNIITGAAWNKLFKNEILQANNIKFANDIFKSEDTLFVAEYYQYCSKFYYIPECLYHYRMNPLSKTQETFVKKEYNPKKNTMVDVGERIAQMYTDESELIRNVCHYRLLRCCLWVMMQWVYTGYYNHEYAKKIQKYAQKYNNQFCRFKYARLFHRLVMAGTSISPRMVWHLGILVNKIFPSLIKMQII